MARLKSSDVRIGKFDILATYTYARALLHGDARSAAKEKGMVAAVMGARARLGHGGGNDEDDYKADKEAAEKKKSATITARSFDQHVSKKMGKFFDDVFLPAMKGFVEAHLSYEDVKRLLRIPAGWGAKISGQQFRERASEALKKGPGQ
jgi:hypothetical protein